MLDIQRVLKAKPKPHERAEAVRLDTPWTAELAEGTPLCEHPRPQFARSGIDILNGWWDVAFGPKLEGSPSIDDHPAFDGKILVPFSPEAPASGVGRRLEPDETLWYRRTFDIPELAGKRLLLHFEAVDHACTCWCNGKQVGTHEGGYLPFAFDITDALVGVSAEIVLCVTDPSDTGTQPRGKQKLQAGDIWYTAQSGIWQTVWLEVVPAAHIENVRMDANPDDGALHVRARTAGPDGDFYVWLLDGDRLVAEACVQTENGVAAIDLPVERPCLWSPDDPYLYSVQLAFGDDSVRSYCAFRTVGVERDAAGTPRFCLNHKPVFLRGVLDQGYWSDGLLTAPSDAALIHDIESARRLGFNMIRKHIKVESDRWYWHCDRLGMLVWQDMVNGGTDYSSWHTSYKPTLFSWSWTRFPDDTPKHRSALSAGDAAMRKAWTDACMGTVRHLTNHPSIVTWVLFNEGWGQFDAAAATKAVRAEDPTRPIDATSGWYDQRCGDYFSIHNYFRPLEVLRDPAATPRAFVLSEFGGLAYHVDGHSALELDYGYETYANLDELKTAVRAQLAAAEALESKGCCGYVYTQLSDVEEETNGLLTFDRKINKLVKE